MIKKEIKKYYLAERICTEKRTYESYEEYKELINAINKYNSIKEKKYFCTKPEYIINENTGLFDVSFIKYGKLTKDAQSLKGIDLLTTKHLNLSFLKEELNLFMSDTRNQINIVYRSRGSIETKPIIYFKDKKYLDKNYIINSMLKHAEYGKAFDSHFFVKMCYDKTFCSNPKNIPYLDKIEYALSKACYSKNPKEDMYDCVLYFVDFYTTNKDGNENYLNLRNLGLYCKANKPKEIVDKEVYEQLEIDLEEKPKTYIYKPKNDK